MADRKSSNPARFVRNGDGSEHYGYKPQGQRGYQPQSSKPVDPMKLKPPAGGSAVQPPQAPASQTKR